MKYKDKNQPRQVQYLRFEEGKFKEISVNNWDFTKHPSGYLFKCFVTKEDGKDVDKVWTVWDYDTMERLKKKLGTRYVTGEKELKVKKVKNEDEETCFELE